VFVAEKTPVKTAKLLSCY